MIFIKETTITLTVSNVNNDDYFDEHNNCSKFSIGIQTE